MGLGESSVLFISGAISMGCWLVGLYFLRYWRQSRDRLFLRFAFAFALLGIERIALLIVTPANEAVAYVYLFRFFAFLVIIFAIIAKNRQSRGVGSVTSKG